MLQLNKYSYDLNRPLVMGILNITPDSFSDGGQYLDFDQALKRAEISGSLGFKCKSEIKTSSIITAQF